MIFILFSCSFRTKITTLVSLLCVLLISSLYEPLEILASNKKWMRHWNFFCVDDDAVLEAVLVFREC
jgi:hypothetical protein